MCVFRKLKKKIDGIANSQIELTKIIKTQELERLRNVEKNYSDLLNLVKHITIKVKSCNSYIDQNTGSPVVKVVYTLPDVLLTLNDKDDFNKNDMFYAINKLDMISIEDMQKVIRILDKAKESKNE